VLISLSGMGIASPKWPKVMILRSARRAMNNTKFAQADQDALRLGREEISGGQDRDNLRLC
jgi:hypothetical protein